MHATWDDDNFTYRIDAAEIDDLVTKGASEAVANEFNANLRVLTDRLFAGQISVQEWYTALKREDKMLLMSQAVLANGGFEQMTPEIWERVERNLEARWNGVGESPWKERGEFPGLRRFAEDVAVGRYGTDRLSSAVLSRAALYPDSSRLFYENERMITRLTRGPMEARRVRGFNDGCDDCIRWAALGWIDAYLMLTKFPVGFSECGGSCNCVIVMRPAPLKQDVKIPRALLAAAVGAGTAAAIIAAVTGKKRVGL